MTATATTAAPATKAPKATKAAKPSANGHVRKMPKPHRQVLATLAKIKEGSTLSRRTIADRVGKHDKIINGRIAQETLTYTTLEESGLIKGKQVGGPGEEINEYGYHITPKGRAALAAK